MVTLVLLPGMDGTGELFAPLISVIGADFPVTVVRYPEGKILGYAELEALVRAALPAQGPFILLAESFSGPIAISIAASAPAELVGLILCCSFARNPKPGLSALRFLASIVPIKQAPVWLLGRFLLGRFSDRVQRAALAAALARVRASVLRARMLAVVAVDVSAALSQIQVPVLYLRGAQDRVVPAAAADLVLGRTPHARLVELEGPHFLLQAVPREAAREIGAFARGWGEIRSAQSAIQRG